MIHPVHFFDAAAKIPEHSAIIEVLLRINLAQISQIFQKINTKFKNESKKKQKISKNC